MTTTPRKIDRSAASGNDIDAVSRLRFPKQDACCEGPCDLPWRNDDQCLVWYETRYLNIPIGKDSRPVDNASVAAAREYIQFRIIYEHRLCRLGKQLGPLLYTVTLLPGEKVTLYHSDRFTRITSTQERFSVETTFTQFLSQIHEARITSELDLLGAKLSEIGQGSAAAKSGLAGAVNLPQSGKTGNATSNPGSLNLRVVSDQFDQSVHQASQMTHAERSVVISTYAESDVQNVTSRTLQNDNACRAVTYFVRKVVEIYEVSTIVSEISYRIVAPGFASDWHPSSDLAWLPPPIQSQIKSVLQTLPKVGELLEHPKRVFLPTDGTVYDPELAHCSSCEPARALGIEIELKKKLAEAELLELEAQRRRMLLQNGDLAPFEAVECDDGSNEGETS